MTKTDLSIPGVVLSSLQTLKDERGSFAEIMRANTYPDPFVQSNHSHSHAGVLRGLHYHREQADLWYVVSGRARVGLADLRRATSNPQTMVLELDGGNPETLYIPRGVAHGFLALTALHLIYWVTNYYDASDEFGVAWNDPTLRINWDVNDPILSDRDINNPLLDWDRIQSFS
jgi:dTDP-4-dehydrorhamnose 3,5-epimerase